MILEPELRGRKFNSVAISSHESGCSDLTAVDVILSVILWDFII